MPGLLALLGFMAIAAGVKVTNGQLAIPQLLEDTFPAWFAGVAFAAIGIGALVPAAIMSIAAANLFTRNIYKDFIKPDATPKQETRVSKLVSLLVKVGALVFVLTMDKTVAINFQLPGGIWILQTFQALVGGLFTRWFHRWALLAGWAAGLVYGTLAAHIARCTEVGEQPLRSRFRRCRGPRQETPEGGNRSSFATPSEAGPAVSFPALWTSSVLPSLPSDRVTRWTRSAQAA